MNIFVYSDESGVFDKVHNEYFVFGGLIFLGKEKRDIQSRKYSAVERNIRQNGYYEKNTELKATFVTNKEKYKLYRSLNKCIKFGVIIHQKDIHDGIYSHKKSKQRYLDYSYKIALKRAFEHLINIGRIKPDQVEDILIYSDEHTTATNGRYELREAIEQELKLGTINYNNASVYPPIFPNMGNVCLKYCDSKANYLIRAADIVSNNIYHRVVIGDRVVGANLFVTYLP